MTDQRTIFITGGAGFIGSNLIHYWIKKYPEDKIINIDLLTYAGNPENLKAVEDHSNYYFVKEDIRITERIFKLYQKYQPQAIIHLAAESHVDRSISDPGSFASTNVMGTLSLLNASLKFREEKEDFRFYHISTDEVYGSLGKTGVFTEKTPYDPGSPYSASKASSDHFVRAYHNTYDLDVVISNCSNNYGPYQFPEKLIPLMINNVLHNEPLPVYGDGQNVRDWLYVLDHAAAIDKILSKGRSGETYNIGGRSEKTNLELVQIICDLMDEKLGSKGSRDLITFVKDRPGHDFRYAIDSSKLEDEMGWKPAHSFKEGLDKTIKWYLDNQNWLKNVVSGDYQDYYRDQYG